MSCKVGLTLVSQLQGYFRELVTEVLEKQKIIIQPETEFYLVNLLNQFMSTDQLYPPDSFGQMQSEPLALMLKKALDQPLPHLQCSCLRHMGDVSLYIAGFFQESLNRKAVDVDYYISMGETAYREALTRTDQEAFKLIYQELYEKFACFVEVFAEISDKTNPKTEKDILRLYEIWVKTKSERAAKALSEMGIHPNHTLKKSWQ